MSNNKKRIHQVEKDLLKLEKEGIIQIIKIDRKTQKDFNHAFDENYQKLKSNERLNYNDDLPEEYFQRKIR